MSDASDVPVPGVEPPSRGAPPAVPTVRWSLVVAGVVGLVLVAAGARMVVAPHVFGFFAYSPMQDVHFSTSITAYFWRSAVCIAAGALLLGGVGGYWLGRRAAARR